MTPNKQDATALLILGFVLIFLSIACGIGFWAAFLFAACLSVAGAVMLFVKDWKH